MLSETELHGKMLFIDNAIKLNISSMNLNRYNFNQNHP